MCFLFILFSRNVKHHPLSQEGGKSPQQNFSVGFSMEVVAQVVTNMYLLDSLEVYFLQTDATIKFVISEKDKVLGI